MYDRSIGFWETTNGGNMTIHLWGTFRKYAAFGPKTDNEISWLALENVDKIDWSKAPKVCLEYEQSQAIQRLPAGDFPSCSTGRRLVSERAVNALGVLFNRHGTLHPVELEGEAGNYYLFRCHTFLDCLDVNNSRGATKSISGETLYSQIRDPAFFEDRLGDVTIFRLPQVWAEQIYVTDEFKNIVKKAKLKGLELRKGYHDFKPWRS